MATITPKTPVIAGAAAPFAATATTGDEVTYQGGHLVVEFQNDHGSSITVNVVPTQAIGKIIGGGPATVPTRSLAIAAGETGVFMFSTDNVTAYKNASNRIPFTYTSGNVALKIRAFTVK